MHKIYISVAIIVITILYNTFFNQKKIGGYYGVDLMPGLRALISIIIALALLLAISYFL